MGASLLLGAMLAGFAAWTKNEGLVLLSLLAVAAAWLAARHRTPKPLVWAAAGALPPLISIAWLKFAVMRVPPGYFSESDTTGALVNRLFASERLELVGSVVAEHWARWGGPGAQGLLPLITGAVVLAAVVRRRASRPIALVTAAMFVAYVVSWVLSPLDTRWLVTTSADRLLAQLWPSMVIASFSSRSREEPDSDSAAAGLPG
jgi:hypothetical protein